MLVLWFVKRRGLVSGFQRVCLAGFSIAPLLLAYLIVMFEWRGALWFMAIVVVAYGLFAFVFVRDNPESVGLVADGGELGSANALELEVESKSLIRPVVIRYFGFTVPA